MVTFIQDTSVIFNESCLTRMKHFYIHVLFLQCTGEILLYENKNKKAIICQFVFILKLCQQNSNEH